jgi:ABC-type branched-subunit amino acid transport system substrate-binding protein
VKRRLFLAGTAAATAAGIAPVGAQQQPQPVPLPYPNQQFLQQLTIGVNVTLSGPLEKYGQEIVKGVQAAVDETNRFNAPINYVWGMRSFDDRNDAALAATNANVAAAIPSVIAMVGNLTAPMTIAALSHYANVNFAVIVPTVTADAVTARGYHNVYRLPARDTTSGSLFASSVLRDLKPSSALAIAIDGEYGFDVARGFAQQAKADHRDADVLLFSKDSVDPAAAARTVLDRNPGYVFLSGKTTQLGPIAEALRLAGYTAPFGASDGFYNSDTIDLYSKVLDGAYVGSSLPPLQRVPAATSLLSDFEREVTQITAFSAYGYAAAQIIISASQRANASVRTTLLTSMQHGGTYSTIVGQFSFNVSGDPLIPDIYLYTVGKGGFNYERPAVRTGYVL